MPRLSGLLNLLELVHVTGPQAIKQADPWATQIPVVVGLPPGPPIPGGKPTGLALRPRGPVMVRDKLHAADGDTPRNPIRTIVPMEGRVRATEAP